MSWQLRIPYRDRSDPLTAVAEAARELPTDESVIVRKLVLDEIVGGSAATVGDLLDKIENASPEQRRKMLDVARVKAGLPETATVEAREKVRRASHMASIKAGSETRPLRLAYTDVGAIVDLNERDDDIAREQARAQSRRRVREDRAAVRAVEAEAIRAHDEACAAALRSELPPGVPG